MREHHSPAPAGASGEIRMPNDVPSFAYVRCKRLLALDLAHTDRHAAGDDSASRTRRVGTGARALSVLCDEDGSPVASLLQVGDRPDYPHEFARHLKRTGARVRRGPKRPARVALHLMVGVSARVLDGNPRDPENPDVQKLVREAWAWADSELGGVWAARYDVDEKGTAIVDVLLSPTVERRYRAGGKLYTEVAPKAATKRLADKWGRKKRDFQAVQDSWADWATRRVHPDLQRGVPAEETGRGYVTPEQYAVQAQRDEARIAELRQAADKAQEDHDREVDRLEEALAAKRKEHEEVEAGLQRLRAQTQATLEQRRYVRRELQKDEARLAGVKAEIEAGEAAVQDLAPARTALSAVEAQLEATQEANAAEEERRVALVNARRAADHHLGIAKESLADFKRHAEQTQQESAERHAVVRDQIAAVAEDYRNEQARLEETRAACDEAEQRRQVAAEEAEKLERDSRRLASDTATLEQATTRLLAGAEAAELVRESWLDSGEVSRSGATEEAREKSYLSHRCPRCVEVAARCRFGRAGVGGRGAG